MNQFLAIILVPVIVGLLWFVHREQRRRWNELFDSLEQYAKTLKSEKPEVGDQL